EGEMRALGAMRDAGRVGHMQEEPQIDEIEAHRQSPEPSFHTKANSVFSVLRAFCRRGTTHDMMDQISIFVAAVFVIAGLTKGVIGLGLPTISMGLLALVMPPVQAAALLALPSLVTNVWQMVAGPSFAIVVRRLWPMMLGVCLGTWAGMGLMTGAGARYGTV